MLASLRVVATIVLFLGLGTHAEAVLDDSQSNTHAEKAIAATHASGAFDVKLEAQEDKVGDPSVRRFSIEKEIHGDLEATSKGQMLAVSTDVKGSAGYVAMERVTGKLRGKSGSFALQHSGTMSRGAQQLTITVVPDSGTGELAGLTGKMSITIAADGKHSYDFEYTLPATK